MPNKSNFLAQVVPGYQTKGEALHLGAATFEGEVLTEAPVVLPLKTMNRHGLIAGATGTGKTKTLQLLAEGLSEAGVPVLLMDIKGDLSGLAMPGTESAGLLERAGKTGVEWSPSGFPVEFLSLSHEKGTRLRATVAEFGPVLFSKMLDLNATQASLVALVYKFCDDKQLPLLDLKDFRQVLSYITGEAKANVTAEYGLVPAQSAALILRKLIELEQQGAEMFFGEPSFDVEDLLRTDNEFGMISVLRVTDLQDRPKLFSSFMLQLLGELYATLPEAGDLEKPKLVMFIDEAHLIFDNAEKALIDQIESIIRLIRSKGVGIFFCTQSPRDLPEAVLSQLGLKVQHALRAFTAKDRKEIKTSAENFPESEFYDVAEKLTTLGIGEAFVTALDAKGSPTPLAATMIAPPRSRMAPLTDGELQAAVDRSALVKKYAATLDARSAHEILGGKLAEAATPEHAAKTAKARRTYSPSAQSAENPELTEALGSDAAAPVGVPYPKPQAATKEESSVFGEILESKVAQQVMRQAGRTFAATITGAVTRSLLGVIGLGGRRRR
ncbi:MAG: helicase HerA-like domain-containing protein [Chthoniobacteraceae bacterium]